MSNLSKPTIVNVSDPGPIQRNADVSDPTLIQQKADEQKKQCCYCSCCHWIFFILMMIVLGGAVMYYRYVYLREDPLDHKDFKKLTNAEYLSKGYNIMYGNPRDFVKNTDPGIKIEIFDFTYDDETLSVDKTYLLPDKVSATDLTGTCAKTDSTTEDDSASSYAKSLEVNAEVKGSGWGVKFAASLSYRKVQKDTRNQKNIFITTEGKCLAYEANLNVNNLPKFKKHFLEKIKSLPSGETFGTSEKDKYREFIDNYGTHFIQKISMGAVYGKVMKFKKKDWTSMTEEQQKVQAEISGGAAGFFSAEASGSVTSTNTQNETHTNVKKETFEYSMGGLAPENTSETGISAWVKKTSDAPGPIAYTLVQIDKLVKGVLQTKAITEKQSENIQKHLQRALAEYCLDLVKIGHIVEGTCVTWSKWSTSSENNPTDDNYTMMCPYNGFVKQIKYYATFIEIECSDGPHSANFRTLTSEGNFGVPNDAKPSKILDCSEKGFQEIQTTTSANCIVPEVADKYPVEIDDHLSLYMYDFKKFMDSEGSDILLAWADLDFFDPTKDRNASIEKWAKRCNIPECKGFNSIGLLKRKVDILHKSFLNIWVKKSMTDLFGTSRILQAKITCVESSTGEETTFSDPNCGGNTNEALKCPEGRRMVGLQYSRGPFFVNNIKIACSA